MSDARVAGSFRDPSGYVFSRQGHLYRAVDTECHLALADLEKSGLLGRLVRDHLIVDTRFVGDERLQGELARENTGFEYFLEHERLVTITFPYEWTVSMLADAAVLTLDLQITLLDESLSLKDATAYNI